MCLRSNKGFSLTELFVTLVVSGVLIIGAASGYIVHKRSYEDEAGIRDMQKNAQVAMDHVKQVLMTAGLGCQANLPPSGSDVLQGLFRSASRVFTVTNRTDGPDTLTAVTGLRSRTRTNGSSEGNVVALDDTSTFDTAYRRYLFVAPGMDNRYLEIMDMDASSVTLSDSIKVNDDDEVFRVNAHTITLDTDGEGTAIDVDGDGNASDGDGDRIPDLYICDNVEDLTATTVGTAEVAEGIEDIQFQYWGDWCDLNANHSIDEDEWVYDATGNEDNMRAVRVFILARTLLPDPAYRDPNTSFTIADHDIVLDTNEGNGSDSPFDQHYHRSLLMETVLVRNKNL